VKTTERPLAAPDSPGEGILETQIPSGPSRAHERITANIEAIHTLAEPGTLKTTQRPTRAE